MVLLTDNKSVSKAGYSSVGRQEMRFARRGRVLSGLPGSPVEGVVLLRWPGRNVYY
jgi:hypothetical protein